MPADPKIKKQIPSSIWMEKEATEPDSEQIRRSVLSSGKKNKLQETGPDLSIVIVLNRIYLSIWLNWKGKVPNNDESLVHEFLIP